ncbi:hypothetical protein FNJ84_13465 [Paracoccus sp. M683]|uniref:hypothetical protein n=1 Tax=Paracoccus sp. M683 TaxID=2594268 RepID=UPI00117E6691|nr:hypothetical protein [Paracoccus sp. M683]TRW96286.1 hypothetical protein FNJ84_13465 [Paracoccus sp. M683]
MRVDALLVGTPMAVAHPFLDFSRMPWTALDGDSNGDLPYLAEVLTTPPFSERDTGSFAPRATVLWGGMHLHWTLPDSFHQGASSVPVAGMAADEHQIAALDRSEVTPRLAQLRPHLTRARRSLPPRGRDNGASRI